MGVRCVKKERTVCFTGHRDVKKEHTMMLSSVLEDEIVRQIELGAKVFRAGGALGFDTVAAIKVLELRERYPDIELHLLLPCKDQTRGWNEMCVKTYNYCLERADSVIYVSEKYHRGCMHERNRALVDGSDVCIAYCTKMQGGTYYTCSYAKKYGVEVVNIAKKL
jgi:uncharacterized phage-like protein YoqJ